MINIRSNKQIFVDDYIIDTRERVVRTYHQFKRHPANPLLVPEKPWERTSFVYGTVLHDAETGTFRMWYTNSGGFSYADAEHYSPAKPAAGDQHVCYATSEDGLHWQRPNLGIIEVQGSKENNADCPEHRYTHLSQTPDGTRPSFSPDGLHWSNDAPLIGRPSDAAMLFFDPAQDRWFVISVSSPDVRGFTRRSIEITETDLESWSEFETILIADEIDDAGCAARIERLRPILDYDNPEHYHAQLHHMVAFRYGGRALGIVTLWDNTWYTRGKYPAEPLFAGGKDRGVVHMQLVWSLHPDMKNWQRVYPRIPLLELSEPGEWDAAAQLPMDAPVRVGDELWLYYSGFSRELNSPRTFGDGLAFGAKVPAQGIGVGTMRLDGFVSLDASPRGGIVTTKPVIFTGTELTINARALGHITVEILDAEGNPIPGFGPASDCNGGVESISGDSVRHSIKWKNLGKLAGQPIRLRFHMWNSQLYAFQFE